MEVDNIETLKPLESEVMQQLTERGEYSPVELLITIGRLLYIDYEEWRRGSLKTLDEALVNSDQIEQILQYASHYAIEIGLQAESVEWSPWVERSITPLHASRYSRLNDLLSCRYVPARHQMQMDIFYDNVNISVEHRVLADLKTGDLALFSDSLAELYRVDPSHPSLGMFDHLKRYMQHCDHRPCTSESVAKEFQILSEKVVPIAHTLLKSGSRDFLSRYWQRLIRCCQTMPVLERPFLGMLSRLQWEIGHWQGALRATSEELLVKSDLDIWVRRALVYHRLCFQAPCYQTWFLIALLYPQDFSQYIDDQPDVQLRQLWSDFEDTEGMPTELFPAFSLLINTALIDSIKVDSLISLDGFASQQTFYESNSDGYMQGFNAYQTIFRLILVDQEKSPRLSRDHAERSIELRKRLAELSPALMKLYLASFSSKTC